MTSPKATLLKKKEKSKEILEKAGFFKPVKIYVGSATCENAAGAQRVMEVFEKAFKNSAIDFYLSKKGCAGRCNYEPTVEVIVDGQKPVEYVKVDESKAAEIVENLKSLAKAAK